MISKFKSLSFWITKSIFLLPENIIVLKQLRIHQERMDHLDERWMMLYLEVSILL